MKWTKPALVVSLAITLAGEPQSAHAFDPLTAFAVKVGTSLVVKGFNSLLGRATQVPDVKLEKINQIHGELRNVHEDVLRNRKLQIEIAKDAFIHRTEIEDLIINVGEGVKEHVERSAEMERVIAVLATTEKVLRTAAIAREAKAVGNVEEHKRTLETLREELSRIEREGIMLDFSEHLRPVAILPRIGVIQAQWTALQTMPEMDITRTDFVRRAGNWLESQRHPTGETDPVKQTLADLIAGMEHHTQGLARYLAELGRPCSPLWRGYLTVEKYQVYDEKMIEVSTVGVSQAHLKAVQDPRRKRDEGDVHYTDSPLVQPTILVWSKEIVDVNYPLRLRAGEIDPMALKRIHRRTFKCEGSLSESARMRLANNIPNVPGKRAGSVAGQVPTIDYDKSPLTLEELVKRGSCGQEDDCKVHWEHVHMRLEAAKALLMGLYAIRSEVNRTLEWLAAETMQAKCIYWRDEPRICVFSDEIGSAEVRTTTTESLRTDPTEPSQSVDTYRVVRDWRETLNEEQVSALRYDRASAARVRAKAIGRMSVDLDNQVNEIQNAQALNDKHLRDVAAENARMAWVRFAVSIVQDQITEFIEATAEEVITAALSTDGGANFDSVKDRTALVVDSTGESTGEGLNDGKSSPEAKILKESMGRQLALVDIASQHTDGTPRKGVIANSYAESVYGYKSGLSKTQQVALWLPEIKPEITDAIAGMGDGMTLGLTRHIREWTGLSLEVDTTTGEYRGGTMIGWLTPGTTGIKAVPGTMKVIQKLIQTGKGNVNLGGGYSVLVKAGHGQRTQGISLIRHTEKGRSNRLFAFDIVTKFKGPGSLASKLPHFHIGRYKAHLPWEPAWLVPTVVGTNTPEAH